MSRAPPGAGKIAKHCIWSLDHHLQHSLLGRPDAAHARTAAVHGSLGNVDVAIPTGGGPRQDPANPDAPMPVDPPQIQFEIEAPAAPEAPGLHGDAP